jgi:hypothetical protein
MNRMTTVLTGIGTGAAVMYLLDPDRGRRRRALVRDKLVWGARKTADGLAAASRDIANRSTGILAETRGRLADRPVPDDVLVARVRSVLGRYCSHPRAIDVTARDGFVTLRGPILANEADQTESAVRAVRGVEELSSLLEVHERADNVAALQGGAPRPGVAWMQANWSPAARVLAAGAGLTMLGYCMSRRNKVGAEICGWAGAALLARAATNRQLERLMSVDQADRQTDAPPQSDTHSATGGMRDDSLISAS